jgi:hypothetical protein
MTGGDVVDGETGDGEGADGAESGALTTAVAADVAAPDPFLLVAVTITRSVAPASPVERVYVCVRAPVIARQLAPLESQRSH